MKEKKNQLKSPAIDRRFGMTENTVSFFSISSRFSRIYLIYIYKKQLTFDLDSISWLIRYAVDDRGNRNKFELQQLFTIISYGSPIFICISLFLFFFLPLALYVSFYRASFQLFHPQFFFIQSGQLFCTHIPLVRIFLDIISFILASLSLWRFFEGWYEKNVPHDFLHQYR